METLYDLLGALPRDDAEELRSAFRRAVKGAHPDLNPGDPDAGQKFREIVRAHDILGDEDQRAAYDHLLDLAHKEQKQHQTAKAVHKLATSVIALSVTAGVGLGLYIALQQMPGSSRMLQHLTEVAIARAADFAGVTQPAEAKSQSAPVVAAKAGPPQPEIKVVQTVAIAPAPVEKPEAASFARDAIMPVAVTPQAEPDATPPPAVGPPLELAPNDAHSYRERGVLAYRSGDLDGAIADFDRAIQLDPKFSAAYIDRGIVLYRKQRFEQAYADIAHAKRIDKANRAKAAQATAGKKPRLPQAMAFGFPPFLPHRSAKLE